MKIEQNSPVKLDTASSETPKGIAGWLIIPAIGCIWSPIMSTVMLIQAIGMIKTFMPELISDGRLWLSCLIDIVMIIASIVGAIFLFKKLRIAIYTTIIILVTLIVTSIVQAFLSISMFGEADFETAEPIIRACIQGAIWIPYFLKSKRVKNTFVR